MGYESLPRPVEQEHKSIDPVLSSIMSAEEYSHMEHPVPYVFILKSGDTELHYFGTPHISDPKNPVFLEIEAAFKKADPDIVFVEGIQVPKDRKALNERVKSVTRDEAIALAHEAGFALKLAVENNIEWHCPEPNDSELYEYFLAQGFTRDEIFAWEVLSSLPQYLREMKREGFESYSQPFLKRFEEATHWEGFDYSYERAIGIAEDICGSVIDVENDGEASDRIDPIPWESKKEKQTVLNRIGTASTHFRDRKIVSDIAEVKKTHKRIFIVYGASHSAMQEPALRKMLGAKSHFIKHAK